jgi:CubicO group peptidase (beta-lactamase class C family)
LPPAGPAAAAPNHDALKRLRTRGSDGFGVWQGGRLVDGRSLGQRMPSLSITKTIAALAVVRAMSERWLDPDAPLTGEFPEWRNHPAKRRITVRMLVNQSAGFTSGAAELYRRTLADKGRAAVALPLIDPPGEQFRYGPACWEVLAEWLRRRLVIRGGTFEQFMARHLRKLRITGLNWRSDAGGRIFLSTGAELSVDDLGTLGRTVARLARGNDIAGLDAAAFANLASPRSANPMHGAGMWWNRQARTRDAHPVEPERTLDGPRPPAFWRHACLSPKADPAWLALLGSSGKRVYVLPAADLVVARFGRSHNWSDQEFLRLLSA